ncbi:MAG: cell wall hydrolase/autolysin [Sporomusa sp.]|jgi:N-acetylmuramoyl-L-alanine amidase|nr:cell wall hydrolase/autolysin [Sporomusa sp.]
MLQKSVVLLILCLFVSMLSFAPAAHAASISDLVKTIGTPSMEAAGDKNSSSNFLEKIFNFVFEKLLNPLLGLSKGASTLEQPSNSPGITTLSQSDGTDVKPTSNALQGKTIVVDPGHGGSNPGAVANGTRESDHNLAVSLALQDKLRKAGAKVVMTRTADKTVAPEGSSLSKELQKRVDIAEANQGDLFVSVHANSNPDKKIAGAMTFFSQSGSEPLAKDIQSALVNATGAKDRGVHAATFHVLRNTSMPSVLVETGFLTNAEEATLLRNNAYRSKIVQGIFDGVVQFFNN